MATRGSFQKHQKEQARKERRQQKLARRQGRALPGVKSEVESPENKETSIENSDGSESGPLDEQHPEPVA